MFSTANSKGFVCNILFGCEKIELKNCLIERKNSNKDLKLHKLQEVATLAGQRVGVHDLAPFLVRHRGEADGPHPHLQAGGPGPSLPLRLQPPVGPHRSAHRLHQSGQENEAA